MRFARSQCNPEIRAYLFLIRALSGAPVEAGDIQLV
jgi:hypothetical protein